MRKRYQSVSQSVSQSILRCEWEAAPLPGSARLWRHSALRLALLSYRAAGRQWRDLAEMWPHCTALRGPPSWEEGRGGGREQQPVLRCSQSCGRGCQSWLRLRLRQREGGRLEAESDWWPDSAVVSETGRQWGWTYQSVQCNAADSHSARDGVTEGHTLTHHHYVALCQLSSKYSSLLTPPSQTPRHKHRLTSQP